MVTSFGGARNPSTVTIRVLISIATQALQEVMEDTGLHFIRFSARHRAAGGHFTRSDGVQCPSAPKPARSGPGNGLPWTQPSVVFGAHADLGGRRGPSAPKGLVYSPAGVPGRSIRAKLRKSNSDWRETSRRPWQLGAEWREREREMGMQYAF